MITWNPKDYATNSKQQQTWARELIAKLQLAGDEDLLDIGCGDGKVTAELAHHLPHGTVVGLDASREMIAFAADAFPCTQHANLRFVLGDAAELPFANAFDAVFSNACLHWIHDHRPVLAGIRRALRPGGRVLLQMGGAGNAADVLQALELMMKSHKWRRHFHGFSFRYGFHGPDEYRRWLTEAGLRLVRVELIPKHTEHHRESLAGWFRTTWMPYINAVPEPLRADFTNETVDTMFQICTPSQTGTIILKMMRLEVECVRAS